MAEITLHSLSYASRVRAMRPVRGMYYDTSLVYVRIVFVLLVLAVAICNILCVAVLFFGLSLAVYGFKARRNSFPFLFSYERNSLYPRAPWGVVDWVVGRGVAAWAARRSRKPNAKLCFLNT